MVPHYDTDAGPLQWVIPGGQIKFGETLEQAACREFEEETGYLAKPENIVDICKIIRPTQNWHSVTITFSGTIIGGTHKGEQHHPYGNKVPRWISRTEFATTPYHPPSAIEKLL